MPVTRPSLRSDRRRYQAPKKPVTRAVYYRRRAVAALALVTFIYASYLAITLVQALNNPSYGVSMSARGAEWGREHGLGGFVTWVETEWYNLNPPKKGGKPSPNSFGSGPSFVNVPASGHLPAPVRIVSPASPALPGEGVWHVEGRRSAKGIPGVYEAFVRPDAVHTSFVVGVAWMDPSVLRARLYSGSFIPGGGPFADSAPISAIASRTLVTSFNAGFRMQDANGGYYTDGRIVNGLPLRQGAAALVIYKNGKMTVGQWGRDFHMTKDIVSVRQNLDLIVDKSMPVAGLDSHDTKKWGVTLGGAAYVWRSGMGVTANGALVYVGGPSLSITDLADVLVRAGAVRAMELDINTDWVQYSTFTGPRGKSINGGDGKRLLTTMIGPPSRYFASWWNRDFITMSLR